VWIGVKLLLPEHEEGHGNIQGSDKLWGAVKTVIVADLVMSVDNVIAIAGAAESSGTDHGMALVIFGVLVSIPIIVWGSQLVIKLMDRFPLIITAGGMLLGWIAGTMAVSDPVVANPDAWQWMLKVPQSDAVKYGAGIAGALFVLALGKWIAARNRPAAAATPEAAPAAPTGRLRRVLLAVDGSDPSDRAVQQVVAMRNEFRDPGALEVHLLNVQSPVPSDVSSFVAKESLQEFHGERSDSAMASARDRLRAAGVSFSEHQRVGSPGATIAELAQAEQCDLIVLGSRGQGKTSSALLGSVAQGTIEHSAVPVMVVK
jgi:nucleotide-binding universal stress UspA family protein